MPYMAIPRAPHCYVTLRCATAQRWVFSVAFRLKVDQLPLCQNLSLQHLSSIATKRLYVIKCRKSVSTTTGLLVPFHDDHQLHTVNQCFIGSWRFHSIWCYLVTERLSGIYQGGQPEKLTHGPAMVRRTMSPTSIRMRDDVTVHSERRWVCTTDGE